MTVDAVTAALVAMVVVSAPVLLAGIGELLAERTGVINLGIEGNILLGAVTAIIATSHVPNAWLGLIAAMVATAFFGMLFAFVTVRLRANQILAGLGILVLGTGLSGFIGTPHAGTIARARFSNVSIPLLSEIPVIGEAFFDQPIPVYLALLLPVVAHLLLHRTHHGLGLRAVGEDPGAADMAGVNVRRLQTIYVCLGSALAGAAGAHIALGIVHQWTEGVSGGRGWIAIAVVIATSWRPLLFLVGGVLFAGMFALGFIGQAHGWSVAPPFLSMVPYVATLIALIVASARRQGAVQTGHSFAPGALGIPFERRAR